MNICSCIFVNITQLAWLAWHISALECLVILTNIGFLSFFFQQSTNYFFLSPITGLHLLGWSANFHCWILKASSAANGVTMSTAIASHWCAMFDKNVAKNHSSSVHFVTTGQNCIATCWNICGNVSESYLSLIDCTSSDISWCRK